MKTNLNIAHFVDMEEIDKNTRSILTKTKKEQLNDSDNNTNCNYFCLFKNFKFRKQQVSLLVGIEI